MKKMMRNKSLFTSNVAYLIFILSVFSFMTALPAVSFGAWNTSVIDSTGSVGEFTSIALDSNSKVHISYYDATNYDLKYATNASGAWATTTIDSAGSVGIFSSIAIDSNNRAHISYYAGYPDYDLRYATNASGSWTTTTIDSTGDVGRYSSIAIDSDNKAHISYYDYSNKDLKYATNSSGSWTTSTIDSSGNVGYGTSIAVDSNNKAHISYYDYYDSYNSNIKYATNASGAWTVSTIDSAGGGLYDSSIAIDSLNKAHISYFYYDNWELKYATNVSGPWTTATIDSWSGDSSSITVDSGNKVHIGYYNYDNYDLKYATNASGPWTTSTIDSSGDVGYYASIATDPNNNIHISYYDVTNKDLKHASHIVWTPVSGTWTNENGELSGTDTTGPIGITLRGDALITNPMGIESDYLSKTDGGYYNGFIVFDYQGPNDFKYAGAKNGLGKWLIGYYDGSWHDLASMSEPIGKEKWYRMRVEIDGSTARLYVDDDRDGSGYVFKTETNFASMGTGLTGLAVYYSHSHFDNFEVYPDKDGDGYTSDIDCNDTDPAIHPGAAEVCDGMDNNCDGQTDEGLTFIAYYRDADGDGYGNPAISLSACNQPVGYVTDNTDCNDNYAAIHPGAQDVCDYIDNDCDGQTDEDYFDADVDGVVCNDNCPGVYNPSQTDIDDDGAGDACDDSTPIPFGGSLDDWAWRNPSPTGNTLRAAAYGNGIFVAVGEAGTVLTSPDGITWDLRITGITSYLYDIVYGSDTFVAVGASGGIFTSPDGVTWTQRTSGTTNYLYGVTYVSGTFVAVGDLGTILTSTDGTTWTQQTSGTTAFFNSIAYGNGTFVAVGRWGSFGIIFTSPDGITWAQSSGTEGPLTDIVYGNGAFVAVGYHILSEYGPIGDIYTSPDGITWTKRDIPEVGSLSGIIYSNGSFVAVGGAFLTGNGAILSSPDGATWTPRTSGTNKYLYDITYGNNEFIAIGRSGVILTSPDSATWTPRTLGITNPLEAVTYGNDAFVAVGWNGTILTSPDGTTWIQSVSGTTSSLYGITYGSDSFVAVGASGGIFTSPDGVTWTLRSWGTSSVHRGIAYGNNTFVAVGYSGTILTSPDGITWTLRTSGTNNYLFGITYGSGIFVAVGYDGTILTSPDGITWTKILFGTDLYCVTYGNGTFVAVGGSGNILTSTDGTTWTLRTSGTTNYLYGVTYGNNTFVAVGGNGVMLTSPDGVIWTLRSSGTTNYLYGVTYGNGSFVVVGSDGTILQSLVDVWTPLSGTWAYDNGEYSGSGEGMNVSLISGSVTTPNMIMESDVFIDPDGSSRNAFIIFDYQGPTDFKYAYASDSGDHWGVGYYNGSYNTFGKYYETIDTQRWYRMKIFISGNTASLYVDEDSDGGYVYKTQATFAGIGTGRTGLATVNSHAHFNDFVISTYADKDGDGYTSDIDCNDTDPTINPGAAEVCDGMDNNCDGQTDEGFDHDGDGYTICGGDCNDDDPTINPGAIELYGNCKDDDCSPETGDPALCVPSAEYPTIQTAVDAAQNGDIIHIAQGTYHENVRITKGGDLQIEGGWDFATASHSEDPSLTVIDGSEAGRVFYIDPADGDLALTIKDLTVQNGRSNRNDGYPGYNIGSGIYAVNFSPYTIGLGLTNNIIRNNQSLGDYGDGAIAIMARQGDITATLNGNKIHDNHADADSGGILFLNYSNGKLLTVNMDDNDVYNNTASFGAGIMFFSDGRWEDSTNVVANLTNNRILNNSVDSCLANADFGGPAYGGGISVIAKRENTADITLTGNIISGNQAVAGAGLYLGAEHRSGCTGPCDAKITLNSSNNTITGNGVPSACSTYADVSNGGGVSINIDPDIAQTSVFDFSGDTISGNDLHDLILETGNRNNASITIAGEGISAMHQYGSRSYNGLCPENGDPLYYRPCILTDTGALVPDCTDRDGDGYFAEGGSCGPADCNDADPAINPEAAEVCDGTDNNCDEVADDETCYWTPVSGTWAFENGEYSGLDSTGPFGITIYNYVQSPQAAVIESDFFSRPDGAYQNGLIIFDYYSPDDFKYAAAKDGADKWVIGYVNGDRAWHDIASFSDNIDTSRWYRMRVELTGTNVKLYVDDDRDESGYVYKTEANFTSMGTGYAGLGVRWSHAHFDNFAIGSQ